MTGGIAVKKAGEKVAKEVLKQGHKALAATGEPEVGQPARIPLRPPRAVTAQEAPHIEPHREAGTSTMMPWRGWFQGWLQDTIGQERFEKIRNIMLFDPNDKYDGWQQGPPNLKIPYDNEDPTKTAMYRHPSPGSQAPPREPEFEIGEDPYDSGYFKRDTRRRYESTELLGCDPAVEKARLALMDAEDPVVQEEMAKVEAGPESSPGNKGVFATGPTDFDPTGLRASMSVTWKAYNESLDAHEPDHFPTPVWEGHEEEIIQWHEERDLPVPVGGYYKPLKVPRERRIARW